MNELARRAGVNQPTLQRIEATPDRDPALSIAVKIAHALNLPIEVLVGSGHKDFSPLVVHPDQGERLERIEERVDLLTEMVQAMAAARAETLEAEVAEETKPRKRPA